MPSAWPASLPQCFLHETYSAGSGDGLIRSQSDQGPAIIRRRFTAVPRPMAGEMAMTLEQLETLLEFADDTLLGRSAAFEFPAQRGENSGNALLVRFREPPTWADMGRNLFRVHLQLEVMP